ncbi:hypothetical protein [Streptomyces sp. NPDC017964]|uniref:hypothetical protein n=1 Tax=Streptomyces sp. NPDC017964 TaxID=3365022 RepID=UPI003794A2B8
MTTETVTAASLASQAAEAIREFNHRTFPDPRQTPELLYPSTVGDAVASLKVLAQRLPQAIAQTSDALATQVNNGHVGAAYGDADTHAADVLHRLITAQTVASLLAKTLDSAHNSLSPLTYSGPDDEPDEEPCGEGMCQCYCVGTLHPCGCDCPHDDDCDCDFCDTRDQY